eukprot:scaffold17849_cov95-Skeletonema_dohrnii-CCMP3373.AAC.1
MVIKVRKAVGRPNTNAIKPTAKPPSTQWYHAILPFIAGLLHLQVFYYAIHCIIPRFLPNFMLFFDNNNDTTTAVMSSQAFMNECYRLDRAIFIAYLFDLVCCYLKVIPFSRSNSSRDIIGHHIPTLILALPLAIPLWANLRSVDPTVSTVLNGDHSEIRNRFIDAYILASGFAYISSLNEVIMCFQRVEMTLAGITKFRDIQMMKSHLFTSRGVVGFELCYKMCFFWGMSILACKACCEFDKSIYDAITAPVDYDKPIWKTVVTLYSSPAVLRGALFRAFSVVMYPSMGARCFKKIKQFLKEGEVL